MSGCYVSFFQARPLLKQRHMESDNSNLQNTSIRYLVNAYFYIFFWEGGGVGGEAPSPSDRPYMGCLVTSKKFPSLDSNG